jgi:hypothetical protein
MHPRLPGRIIRPIAFAKFIANPSQIRMPLLSN